MATPIYSPADAIDIGYGHGKTLRDGRAKPEDFEFNLGLAPCWPKDQVNYDYWLKGFRAGYFGEQKPTP
jgi:hypothetical protein